MKATFTNVCSEYAGSVAANYIDEQFCTLRIRYHLDRPRFIIKGVGSFASGSSVLI